MSSSTRVALVVSFLTFVAVPLAAQDGHGRRPPGGGPPPEALAACASHARGASCSFTGPRGESLTGTCGAPEGLPLACMPAGGPPHGPHGGPPPEALTACRDVAVGDACVVDTPHGALEGSCRTTPHGTACVPHDMRGGDAP